MKPSTLNQLSWQDVQEIWIEATRALKTLDTDPANHPKWTSSSEGIFTEVLKRLKAKKK